MAKGLATEEYEAEVRAGRPQRDETPAERLDRNFNEMLGGLRVALPGVQVLFAFLLTVPFSQGFASISQFQRILYLGVLLSTALASFLLITPTAYHRMVFRQGRKGEVVSFANRIVLVGLAFLGVAMTGAILLITHFLFGPATAIPVTVVAGLVIAVLWYLLPWARGR
jgi:high-affinity Fe2+/Pb2+ permease